jgi:hypothetical protein
MSDFWDEFQSNGDFVAFKNYGDAVVGEVLAVRKANDFNGNPCPELIVRTDAGDEKTVTAGQVMLKAALADARPTKGDRVAIVYTHDGEGKPGKAPAKCFDVQVKRVGTTGPDPVAAQPQPQPQAQQPAEPAVSASALL